MSWEMTAVPLSHRDGGTPTASVSGSSWPEASVCADIRRRDGGKVMCKLLFVEEGRPYGD